MFYFRICSIRKARIHRDHSEHLPPPPLIWHVKRKSFFPLFLFTLLGLILQWTLRVGGWARRRQYFLAFRDTIAPIRGTNYIRIKGQILPLSPPMRIWRGHTISKNLGTSSNRIGVNTTGSQNLGPHVLQ